MFDLNNDFGVTDNEAMNLDLAKRLFAESENLEKKIVEELSSDLVQKIFKALVKKLQEHPVNFTLYVVRFRSLQETIGSHYKSFKLTQDCYKKILDETVAKLEKKNFTVALRDSDQLNQEVEISGWA